MPKHRKAHENTEKRREIQKNTETQTNAQKNIPLEAPWASPGRVLVALGWPLGALGHSWDALGALSGRFWGALGALGGLLGASWTPLGRNLEKMQFRSVFWSPTWRPKSTQVGSKILEKSISKKTSVFKHFFYRIFRVLHWFLLRSKNLDFLKNSIFPRENHVFWEFRFLWQGTFLNSQPFKKINLDSKKPSKIGVKIH